MAEKMKHCPFCNDFKPFTASRMEKRGVYVGNAGCATCGASIPGYAYTHEDAVNAAIKAWNTRTGEEDNG